MERIRKKKIKSRGVLLFAFNSSKYNYAQMAVYTARRIEAFLGLPTTLVTDVESLKTISPDLKSFDKIIEVTPDTSNIREQQTWFNKGRFQAYEHSPYEETLVLDVDYLVNSDILLKTFDLSDTFCCHKNTHMLMHPDAAQEKMSAYSYDTLWATVIMFKKSKRAKQIFETLEMVQENYDHYANIHSFVGGIYRNDYGLTIALKIVNGHTDVPSDYIPWSLVHVGKNTSVYPDQTDLQIPCDGNLFDYNTEFTIMFDHWKKSKVRKEYMTIKDMDFHVMNKELFVGIMNG
jgi:hypothetical protein